MNLVPNLFPTLSSDKRIALIGEAPGADEVRIGQPFVGASGRFLAALLSRAGISREACFLGNISQHQPPGNDISRFEWNGLQIQHGLGELAKDIEKFNPHIIVCLGNVPLKAAKDPSNPHPLKKFRFKNADWRGSLFLGDEQGPFGRRKCLSTLHPAYCLRCRDESVYLQFDLRKAVREGANPELRLPFRKLDAQLSFDETITRLRQLRTDKRPIALDIEGYVDAMSCISFAPSEREAFIVPFFYKSLNSCWEPTMERAIWRELVDLLEDQDVPKILQNSLYDRFVLHYSYGIRVANVVDDTMLKHWELYSELEKKLNVQCSLYTDEPFYKGERKTQDDLTFFTYCCKDSAVTHEINGKLERFITHASSKEHYRMNVALLNPLLYMEIRGMAYDILGAKERRDLLRLKMHETQARLNALTGRGFTFKSKAEIENRMRELMWTKKGDRVFKDYLGAYEDYKRLINQNNPDLATIGELEDVCEVSLNVNAPKQIIPFLYDELKLPVQYTQDKTKEPTPTADYEALLKLSRELQKHDNDPRLPVIHSIIELRALQTRQQMLSISADRDGRIRCGYNIVGSNTGRITCYESPTGSGYNLQTIPNYTAVNEAPGGVLGDRDLFVADKDHWLFQCDLSGADGWTVAAYAAMLGDETMLLDYKAGVSPFKILTLVLRGLPVPEDRNELRQAVKVIEKDAWDRFAMKRVQHGGAYLEGGLTISRNILKDSEGKLYLPPAECERIRDQIYFKRYRGIRLWHNWVARRLKERPFLTAASGQVRQFFGHPDEILTKAVAFEPQANTTYATNLAMFRLWTDPENRSYENDESTTRWQNQNVTASRQGSGCILKIEPLHQVHDALVGQFPKVDTQWAATKIKSYFNNTLIIAGQRITIPYEGGYGRSWGSLNEGSL